MIGSLVFLGAFYAVLAVVAATVACAAIRSRRALAAQQVDEIRWHETFHELPPSERQCRHVATGEFRYRECPHAFDCRICETHTRLVARKPLILRDTPQEEIFGMSFPLDRFYHRGHTWVRPEPDGTVTIGLDELGRRVLSSPDRVELPPAGAGLRVNGTAWRVHQRNADVRLLSPVEGQVVEVGGPDWVLRVKPADGCPDLRHLLTPEEVRPWLLREMERLQLALSPAAAPTLADGGVLVDDIAANYPEADWDAVCGELFLQG